MSRERILNIAALVLLRLVSPKRAHAILQAAGQFLWQRTDPDSAREALSHLRGTGTCLSRSMAVAATTPAADVVIGVALGDRRRFNAHAWLEMGGQPLNQSDPMGHEIARLRGRASTL